MSEKTVLVTFNDVSVKIKYIDFENLIEKSKSKHGVSSNCHLEYEENETWIKVCDDEDLEEISVKTELRLVLKGKMLMQLSVKLSYLYYCRIRTNYNIQEV